MTAKKKKPKKVVKLPKKPTGTRIRHAVVMSTGPGARMMELTRSGLGRKGVQAWVQSEPVVWLTTDRSALIPITPGQHLVTFSVSGVAGRPWDLRVTKPAGAVGGSNGTVPDQGVFQSTIP